ncbi:hypothetical protein PAL_GLEAN10005652 [Pteropus alecto]|uniref:Uncharacterized protein n=1 Tax=Pteropus alecto TaxID=9402 RepID=L5KVK5_PTEAL|nr:hypothetical protein PAL_GLEAN10005652 [Pteropus alecto]
MDNSKATTSTFYCRGCGKGSQGQGQKESKESDGCLRYLKERGAHRSDSGDKRKHMDFEGNRDVDSSEKC